MDYYIILYYFVILLFGIINNIMSILMTYYYDFSFIEVYIFIISTMFYSLFTGLVMTLFDDTSPKTTLLKLYNFRKIVKLKIFITSFPISITYSIIYLYVDPILIQLLNGTTIIFNIILSIIINKKYFLINYKIIILAIFNIISCIIPYIFNINNNIKYNILGIIFIIIMLIINGIIYAITEKFSELIIDSYAFSLFSFIYSQNIILCFISPFIFLLSNYNIYQIRYYFINSLAMFFSLINAPLYIYCSDCIMKLTSLDNAIINNIKIIIIIFVSCIFNISQFHYLYIISFLLIITSSLLIVYVQNKLIQNINIQITSIIPV